MAAEKNRVMKYKPISGRLHEHLGFKLLADGNIKTADDVYCIYCDKSFAYIGSNTWLTYLPPSKRTLATIATALDTRYKNLKCQSDDSKEQTWLLIGRQIAVDINDDRLKTNAQDDTDSVNKTICKSNEKRIKLMESDLDLDEDAENASDEVQRYKIEKKVAESVDPLQ
ncbi:Hypothetical predicted protein [Octopus vulgaris]|uniref:Uncharacterized protein n=1 Tax=Octopus vulgaris TaxID=6645 RepID=A0AA36BGV9_OCTVU|nr:Hypothetical predicted protein [Octopus vulgaris]